MRRSLAHLLSWRNRGLCASSGKPASASGRLPASAKGASPMGRRGPRLLQWQKSCRRPACHCGRYPPSWQRAVMLHLLTAAYGTKCECRLVPVTAASRGEAAGVVAVRQRREMTQPGHAGCSATSQRPGSPLTPLLLHARHRPSAWIGGGAKIGFESWGGRGSPRLLFSVIGGSRPA